MTIAGRPATARGASPTRAGLSGVLLLYFLGVILVITLSPFQFHMPSDISVRVTGKPFDIVTNVLLFFPLGFLYPLSRPAQRSPSPIEVLGLGLALSAAIEAVQLFDVGRVTSLVDVVTNAGGALLGALAARLAMRRVRIDARHVGRLALEIPLVGLFYLLLPLLLAMSMRAVREPVYLLALAPVVFIGTRLLSSVQRHHFAPSKLLTNGEAGVVGATWILLGTFPVLLVYHLAGTALVAAAGAVTWLQSAGAVESGDRRFEAEALDAIRPLVVTHVLCVVLLPIAAGIGRWQVRVALAGARGDLDLQMLQLLAPVATLTVLGYLLAEMRGRREMPFTVAVRRIAVECGVVALAIEIARGFELGAAASVSQFLATLAAGMLGAGIYHSQREHVRWIIAHRTS